MNYLVVIDTNVLISALLSKHRDAATVRVLEAVLMDRLFLFSMTKFLRSIHRCFAGQNLNLIMVLLNYC